MKILFEFGKPAVGWLRNFISLIFVVSPWNSVATVQLVLADSEHLTVFGTSETSTMLIEIVEPKDESWKLFVTNVGPGNFRIAVPRYDESRDRLYSGFALGSSSGHEKKGIRFPEGLERISQFRELFPQPKNKKGLQIQMLDDALDLGIQHASLNINLSQLIDPGGSNDQPFITIDGQRCGFNARYLSQLDSQVSQLTSNGVAVTFILLAYRSSNPEINRIMFHPNCATNSPNNLTAFNTKTLEGVQWYKATIEFLAQRFSGTNANKARVANYIVGNEVNSHWFWYNMGRISLPEFIEEYAHAMRITHTGVRKYSATAKVYVSLEHHWNIRYPGGDEKQAFPAKTFLEKFASKFKEEGDIDWHVAFHPYPENLFEARTWLDKSATQSFDTPRITFKNLEVLCNFLSRPEFLFGQERRRIILSEQGFHSKGTAESEQIQAAAFCYAFNKVSQLNTIDSLIYHRHVDHAHEGGLNLGLWTRQTNSVATPLNKKKIYHVFRTAGSTNWTEASRFALPIIGITNWNQIRADVEN